VWLREHGVAAADARTITRELFFAAAAMGAPIQLLLPDDLRLPMASHGDPLRDGVPLIIGPDDIRAMDRRVVALENGALPAATTAGDPIDPLYDLLAEEAGQARTLTSRVGDAWEGTLVVAAHRDTPWTTAERVLATATQAGFHRGVLVVLVDDRIDPIRTVVLHEPGRPASAVAVPEGGTVADAARLAGER
jgi:hypothetical protein